MRPKWSVLGWVLVLLQGCTLSVNQGDGATGALKGYVSRSFGASQPSDRLAIERFLTGEAKLRLARLSAEEFKNEFINKERELIRILIKKIESPDQSAPQPPGRRPLGHRSHKLRKRWRHSFRG